MRNLTSRSTRRLTARVYLNSVSMKSGVTHRAPFEVSVKPVPVQSPFYFKKERNTMTRQVFLIASIAILTCKVALAGETITAQDGSSGVRHEY